MIQKNHIQFCKTYLSSFVFFVLAQAQSFAQGAATTDAPPNATTQFMMQLPMLLGIAFIFYFALIRPQRQQQKKQVEFLAGLTRGQDIVTSSGMIGTIVGIADKVVTLEVSKGTEVKILKSHVQGLLKESIVSPTKS
jgi:preprotein translocase subunit YajC